MTKIKFNYENRETDLRNKIRFYDPKHRFEVMYYRTNLLLHTRRVSDLLEELMPFASSFYEGFSPKLARLIAKHHDDAELVSKRGDVSLQLKLGMTEVQKWELRQEELKAIDILCKYGPEFIEGIPYRKILMHSLDKDCKEAQLVSYVDKLDGMCESLHEVFAGNDIFLEPVFNYFQNTFGPKKEKFNLIAGILHKDFSYKSPLLQFDVFNFMLLYDHGRRITRFPHTIDSVQINTLIPYYEKWKLITFFMKDGMNLLIRKKEFN